MSGSVWQSAVFYTGPVGTIRLRRNAVLHDELIEFFEGISITNEAITTIWAYKQRLGGWRIGSTIFAHFFLIVKTENFYWLIEKGNDGIHVRTSSEVSTLLNPSDNPEIARGQQEIGSSISRTGTTILDLLQWIKDNNILKKGYNTLKENCIHFAYILYKWLQDNAPTELEESIILLRDVVGPVVPLVRGVAIGSVLGYPVPALAVGSVISAVAAATPVAVLASRQLNE